MEFTLIWKTKLHEGKGKPAQHGVGGEDVVESWEGHGSKRELTSGSAEHVLIDTCCGQQLKRFLLCIMLST